MWTNMLANYCKRQQQDKLLFTLPEFEASALSYLYSQTGETLHEHFQSRLAPHVRQSCTNAQTVMDQESWQDRSTGATCSSKTSLSCLFVHVYPSQLHKHTHRH